jgi:hypothetical protein
MPLSKDTISSGIEEGMGFLKKIGASNFGQMGKDVMGSKKAKGAVLGGLFLAGLSKNLVRPTIKAGMDVAFDDPNADQKVLGTDLTPSMLIGANVGGPIGGLARGVNAYRFGVGATNPYTAQKNTGRVGAALGAVGGGLLRLWTKRNSRCSNWSYWWWNYWKHSRKSNRCSGVFNVCKKIRTN